MICYLFLALFIFHVHLTTCQRYADRNLIPPPNIPTDYHYEEDYSEGYDFMEEPGFHRWNVEVYPHPRENPPECHRIKPSTICDPDSVLQKEELDKLEVAVQTLYKDTACICDVCDANDGGIVVGIALLKHLFQPYNEHPGKIIRTFAEQLRSKWKLGKCDNDILIVIAVIDRLSYTDVGKATANYVSNEEAHSVFLENKFHFTNGNFYKGLDAMLSDFYNKTRYIKLPVKNDVNMALVSGIILGSIFFLLLLLFAIFFLCRYIRKSKDPVSTFFQ
ncbi:uncharacterized protein LOC118192481 [Stegodyphus dumicola]|uniref:uncharacterized protein LOC118192481 n=1 Tax=Stegodyphus dumicola TaxID=202533 RepID=UPI0015AA72EE|nr:uncharacterized protein LOC118192481 [Stegodyphus dumicola]XP_035219363.1 uncharacterized protein LOC118192481 [Stegodyphus dumicola]